ncbi:MAG: thermonuclease family protein [Nitrospinota bacterium]
MRHLPERTRKRPLPSRGLLWPAVLLGLAAAFGCARALPPEPAPAPPPKAEAPAKRPTVTAQQAGPKAKTKEPKEPPELRRWRRPGKNGKKRGASQPYRVKVLRVIDGVTFSLENHNVVRLIGVAPPTPAMGKAYREFFNRVTTPAVRKIVEGKRVQLMRDKVMEGRDHRPLIYMILDDHTMLNATLVQKGYARVSREVPFKFQDEFRLWEREAQNIGLGLWARIGD